MFSSVANFARLFVNIERTTDRIYRTQSRSKTIRKIVKRVLFYARAQW